MRCLPGPLLGLALCLACQTAVAEEPAPATLEPTAPPIARPPIPTVLWTSPPTTPPARTPTATPAPVVAPAIPISTRTPSPSPTARPTPTSEAFKWTRYQSAAAAWLISVPVGWDLLDQAVALPRVDVAMSSEPPHRTLDEYGLLGTVKVWRNASFPNVNAFADLVQSTYPWARPGSAFRQADSHPTAGAVVFLRYVWAVADATGKPTAQRAQQTDALFLSSNGTGVILGLRSPVERLPQNAPVFDQIFLRFAPG